MGRLGILLLMMLSPNTPRWGDYDPLYHSDLYKFSEQGHQNAYKSSLLITATTEMGSTVIGSGNYFHIHGHRFILTAAHVVDGFLSIAAVERSGDAHEVKIIHIDRSIDMAILKADEELRYTKPIDYKTPKKLEVGKEVFYCGQPNEIYFTNYNGRISGYTEQYVLVDIFAWPGASGSVIFDKEGQALGVISSVSMDAPTGLPVLVPHIVRIGPVMGYSRKYILEVLLSEHR